MKLMNLSTIALSIFLLSGCSSLGSEKKDVSPTEEFEVGELDYGVSSTSGGSIYGSGSNALLIGAGSSYQIGDIINVDMSESIDAQDSIESKISQKTSNTSSMGLVIPVPSGDGVDQKFDFELANSKKIDGDGSSSQSHKIEGSIACTVTKVYPNGVLVIKGTKQITLERGSETVAIYGHIREQDISTTTNTISSSRMANAKIYYKGEGKIYEKSDEGWLSSFIGGKYWPF